MPKRKAVCGKCGCKNWKEQQIGVIRIYRCTKCGAAVNPK